MLYFNKNTQVTKHEDIDCISFTSTKNNTRKEYDHKNFFKPTFVIKILDENVTRQFRYAMYVFIMLQNIFVV